MADVVLRIKPATDEKKIGSSVTTITEWALLAQSYIIQLFSSLVYPFSIGTHLVLFRFAKKPYCTMTPQSAPNKTASTAVLHGSMFSKPCAPAQGRVQRTRAAAQAAAALRLVYHIEKCTIPAGKSQVVSLFYRNITRLPAAFCSRFYKIYSKSLEILWIFPPRLFRLRSYTKTR